MIWVRPGFGNDSVYDLGVGDDMMFVRGRYWWGAVGVFRGCFKCRTDNDINNVSSVKDVLH